MNNVTLCYSVSNILDCFFINKKNVNVSTVMIHIYCTAHVIALLASINARRPDVPPPPASRHDAPFPNNAQEKSHVDDPD